MKHLVLALGLLTAFSAAAQESGTAAKTESICENRYFFPCFTQRGFSIYLLDIFTGHIVSIKKNKCTFPFHCFQYILLLLEQHLLTVKIFQLLIHLLQNLKKTVSGKKIGQLKLVQII